MATTVAQLADTLQTLFTTAADQAAQEAGLIRRRRQLTGASFAQGLVFTWLGNPDATLDELAQGVARAGTPLTPQALDERFTPPAAECLRLLLLRAVRHVVAAQPTAVALLRRFRGVYLLDSTTLALPAALAAQWPGCGGRGAQAGAAALKAQVRYELNTGALEGFQLLAGRAADQRAPLQAAPLPPGALRLADLGFFDLDVLQAYDRQGVYFVSRLQATTALFDAAGRKWRLWDWLAAQAGDRAEARLAVGTRQRLACRVLAVRAPEAVARKRRERALRQARDHGHTVSAARLSVCGWTVFLTNAPAALLSLQEAWVLYRVRWQVELLFKLWKSDGGVGRSRSGRPYRVLCEVYAKLLAVVVQHWLVLLGGGSFGERSQRKAARVVRRQALQLASVLGRGRLLRRALRLLRQCLARGGRVNRRRRRPSTYQTLLDPSHDGLT